MESDTKFHLDFLNCSNVYKVGETMNIINFDWFLAYWDIVRCRRRRGTGNSCCHATHAARSPQVVGAFKCLSSTPTPPTATTTTTTTPTGSRRSQIHKRRRKLKSVLIIIYLLFHQFHSSIDLHTIYMQLNQSNALNGFHYFFLFIFFSHWSHSMSRKRQLGGAFGLIGGSWRM